MADKHLRSGDAFEAELTERLTGRPQWISWLLVAGLAALVALFVFSDARELWRVAAGLNLKALLLPVVCSLLSYAAMARSYQGIARAAGCHVPYWEMVKITFVANSVNYVITTGGLSGFAVRMFFFLRMGMRSGTAVTVSLVQTFVTNLVLLFFVVGGVYYLLRTHELQGVTLAVIAALLVLFGVVMIIALFLLLHRQLRRRTLFVLSELGDWILRHVAPRHKPRRVRIWRFQRNLDRGIDFLLSRKRHMIGPVFWIVVDWLGTLYILSTAFLCVGVSVPITFVVVGFAVGIVLSLISLIPGGLGVMEGSMAAIFASLGVPFEAAVVAVLLFRVAYYLLPLVISVFFFRNMMAQTAEVRLALEES
ncbi:MAG: flippase-like domain-containing protein [Candidatus Binatia bacterium]|nr:flippase-like domain-containing protein [Candidatus Binatia bacterium]